MEFVPGDVAVLLTFPFKFEETRRSGTRHLHSWSGGLVPNVDLFIIVVEDGDVPWVCRCRFPRIDELGKVEPKFWWSVSIVDVRV